MGTDAIRLPVISTKSSRASLWPDWFQSTLIRENVLNRQWRKTDLRLRLSVRLLVLPGMGGGRENLLLHSSPPAALVRAR